MKTKRLINAGIIYIMSAVFMCQVFAQTPATLPYSCNFEDDIENAKWTLLNKSDVNYWTIDNAVVSQGVKSLYVNKGSQNSGYYPVFAYRTLTIPEAGNYFVSFDYFSISDFGGFLYAYLVPENINISDESLTKVPEAIFIARGSYMGHGWDQVWVNKSAEISITNSGNYNLVFVWSCGCGRDNIVVGVDNITIEKEKETYLPNTYRDNIALFVENHRIIIENAQGKNIVVYNSIGQVQTTINNNTETRVQVPIHHLGMYIVKIDGIAKKILIK